MNCLIFNPHNAIGFGIVTKSVNTIRRTVRDDVADIILSKTPTVRITTRVYFALLERLKDEVDKRHN